jgi:transmembrane sensor
VTAPPELRAAMLASVKRAPSVRPAVRFAMSAPPRRTHLAWLGLAAAAIVATAAVAGRAFFAGHAAPPAAAARVLATPRGQRATFQLPDGTRVMLAAASTLRYRPPFDAGTREVTLEGEAYFEVMHDERRPFVVRAGDVVAQDLGTQFVVRAYPEDGHARVVVREGEVALRAASAPPKSDARVLGPGELGRLSAAGEPIVEAVNPSAYFAWTTGRLVFAGTSLRDAIPQLSRWYDLEFRLADPALGARQLNATLRSQATTDELDFLAASLGLRQVRRGSIVTLYPDSAAP